MNLKPTETQAIKRDTLLGWTLRVLWVWPRWKCPAVVKLCSPSCQSLRWLRSPFTLIEVYFIELSACLCPLTTDWGFLSLFKFTVGHHDWRVRHFKKWYAFICITVTLETWYTFQDVFSPITSSYRGFVFAPQIPHSYGLNCRGHLSSCWPHASYKKLK